MENICRKNKLAPARIAPWSRSACDLLYGKFMRMPYLAPSREFIARVAHRAIPRQLFPFFSDTIINTVEVLATGRSNWSMGRVVAL